MEKEKLLKEMGVFLDLENDKAQRDSWNATLDAKPQERLDALLQIGKYLGAKAAIDYLDAILTDCEPSSVLGADLARIHIADARLGDHPQAGNRNLHIKVESSGEVFTPDECEIIQDAINCALDAIHVKIKGL